MGGGGGEGGGGQGQDDPFHEVSKVIFFFNSHQDLQFNGMGPLLIVNNLSEFSANIFSNDRDITKFQNFCMMAAPPPTMPPPMMTGLWQYLDVFSL